MKLFSFFGKHAVEVKKQTSIDRLITWGKKPCAFTTRDVMKGAFVVGWGVLVAFGIYATMPQEEPAVPVQMEVVAQEATSEEVEMVTIDQTEALAMGIDAVISSECKGEWISDTTMVMVANVILNRTMDHRYPDTVDQVLMQPYQFSCFSTTGMKWVGRAADDASFRERCTLAAKAAMNGERMLNYGVVYVSSGKQGVVEAQLDGLYFCR